MTNRLFDLFDFDDDEWMDFGDATEIMHAMHPRVIFIKTLRRNSSFLDVGAGDGSNIVFKDWLRPSRMDLKMYAYSLEKGCHFDRYDGFEIGSWPGEKPSFQNMKFDAIFSAHFIEHINNVSDFLKWASSRLSAGGRIYIEWPSDNSVDLPKVKVFKDKGLDIMISNFYDDPTHTHLPIRSEVISSLVDNGFSIDQQGTITNPFIEQEVLAHRKKGKADSFSIQSMFWSRTKWSQYIVATKN